MQVAKKSLPMAKDDYNIIVYKIFAYLYAQLKAGADIDAAIISANGPLFCIHARYWTYVLENLQAQGAHSWAGRFKAVGQRHNRARAS